MRMQGSGSAPSAEDGPSGFADPSQPVAPRGVSATDCGEIHEAFVHVPSRGGSRRRADRPRRGPGGQLRQGPDPFRRHHAVRLPIDLGQPAHPVERDDRLDHDVQGRILQVHPRHHRPVLLRRVRRERRFEDGPRRGLPDRRDRQVDRPRLQRRLLPPRPALDAQLREPPQPDEHRPAADRDPQRGADLLHRSGRIRLGERGVRQPLRRDRAAPVQPPARRRSTAASATPS